MSLDDQAIRQHSMRLAWLLRHGAIERGLAMDAAGWVTTEAARAELGLDAAGLAQVIADNNKTRFEVAGDRLRASQGYSRDGVPVTLEALEASWIPFQGGPRVWHGTGLDALPGIEAHGLLPSNRTHVHLAAETTSKVGKRSKVQLLLAVSVERMRAADEGLWQAPNGVILARRVPVECIEGAVAQSRKARAHAAAAQGGFRWLGAADL